ncbi:MULTISPECIES: hypothetical protein [Methylobacteriaceae]|uniref:hypothetical protein n=1 Tax=Methylobacteriaceae TaxID=119045 RepID=UPI0012E85E62|nr:MULTISPECIES: hypothetical protein [Methylobacteriaceae]MCY1643164.1 hypothetical protein [Methylorubrum sp. SL192]
MKRGLKPIYPSLKRGRRPRREHVYVPVPHLGQEQVERIAAGVAASRVRRMTWEVVGAIARRETGTAYSRQTLSKKPAIVAAYEARNTKKIDSDRSRLRLRPAEDLTTVASLQAQLTERDRIIAEAKVRVAGLETEIDNLRCRLTRWMSNTVRRTMLTEEDLDQPIRYLPRR